MKRNHGSAISWIKMTINRFCDDPEELTEEQVDALLFTLSEAAKLKVQYNRKILQSDDMVMSTTSILLLNLNKNILSSNMTNYIKDYLEILEMALAEDYDKYIDLHNDIMTMLQKQGWIRNRGFQREPKKTDIIKELDEIIQKYTMTY